MQNRFLKQLTLSLCIALGTLGTAYADTATVPSASNANVEQRVNAMLAKLTLEQKVELLGGVDNFYTHAEPNIGLPAMTMSDGPSGVRAPGPSTAYMAGLGLAASWDPNLAKDVGAAMGRDARARGVGFLLGPGVNMYRAPQNGRNMEYFGEDPLLAGSM